MLHHADHHHNNQAMERSYNLHHQSSNGGQSSGRKSLRWRGLRPGSSSAVASVGILQQNASNNPMAMPQQRIGNYYGPGDFTPINHLAK
jgi:hypothetical protein